MTRARDAAPGRDPLARYDGLRDFDRTSEPRGQVTRSGGPRCFVVQQHAARRLHYDVRLELDGVLKSWAVPKGPSLSPRDKRLAVRTEDHPLDYRTFEGTIPKGQYGAGAVIVWDQGTWTPFNDPHEGLRNGHLEFELHGEKLHGSYILIRTAKGSQGAEGGATPERTDKELWLLIKRKEAASVSTSRGRSRPNEASVRSGRTIEDVARGVPPLTLGVDADSERARARARRESDAGTSPLPAARELTPALALSVREVPTGPWLYEIKYDGYRALTTLDAGDVRIATRRGHDWTVRFPEIAAAIRTLGACTAIFDGEIAYVGRDGRTEFQGLQDALGGSTNARARLTYFMFDLLHLDGHDLRRTPLATRKARLRALLSQAPHPLTFGDHIEGDGALFLREACARKLEGIVAKRVDSPYPSGRGGDWVKIKCTLRQEFVIVGFTRSRGARDGLGALLLAVRDDADYRYVGKVGTGWTDKTLHALAQKLEPLATSDVEPPSGADHDPSNVWVRPVLVCEVRFGQWTRGGHLRHASFLGLREDKAPSDVTREDGLGVRAADLGGGGLDASEAKVGSSSDRCLGVRITNRQRIVDPSSGLTKLDLATYHATIASELLALSSRRPLMLVRCTGAWPQGATARPSANLDDGTCFVQRDGSRGLPRDIGKARVDGQAVVYVQSARGLVGLAQHNTVELHGWGSRLPKADKPDWVVFDLDPDESLPFSAVVDAALHIREELARIDLESFVKSTGGKGLHVVVPLRPTQRWPIVRAFAAWVAVAFAEQAPSRYVATMTKAKRTRKIFIDHFRNAEGATAIIPYSPRARPGAPVAMPIGWGDVRYFDPRELTVFTVPGLVRRRRRDPWAELCRTNQTLPQRIVDLLSER